MYERHIRPELVRAFGDSSAVLLGGARQVGKSTLAQQLARKYLGARYLSFDTPATRAAAQSDPSGFVNGLDLPVVIDEVQRVPDVLLPIKVSIDEARAARGGSAPGLFLLTGSASIWTTLRVSESLAGRVVRLPLWPLSAGELAGVRERFVDDLFTGRVPEMAGVPAGRAAISAQLVRGGYPEAVGHSPGKGRREWFANYVGTVLERDVRDLANIRSLEELPRLLALLAARSSGLLNYAQLGRDLEMPRATVQRYLDLLRALYVVQLIPPWHVNLGQRIVKSPKVHVTDSGLAANLLGFDERRFEADMTSVPGPGALFESFVAMELLKQLSWAEAPARICHYRDARGVEVDLVLERDDGSVAGIEVKLTESPSGDDFKGLRHLRDKLGDRFRAGALIYAGSESVPFGERLHALPVSALWHEPLTS